MSRHDSPGETACWQPPTAACLWLVSHRVVKWGTNRDHSTWLRLISLVSRWPTLDERSINSLKGKKVELSTTFISAIFFFNSFILSKLLSILSVLYFFDLYFWFWKRLPCYSPSSSPNMWCIPEWQNKMSVGGISSVNQFTPHPQAISACLSAGCFQPLTNSAEKFQKDRQRICLRRVLISPKMYTSLCSLGWEEKVRFLDPQTFLCVQ